MTPQPTDGLEVWYLPEFQALIKRLNIYPPVGGQWRSLTIRLAAGEVPTFTFETLVTGEQLENEGG